MERWRVGVMEYWNNGKLRLYHHSITPVLGYSNEIDHGSDDAGE
ncbi:MAG: hypothetical protein ABWZ17_11005 [Candidatus Binatia bacterium]